MGLEEVSAILWRERQLLDLLLFKLEEEQLVLAAGRTRWLNHATREVEVVLEELRHAELARAVEVDRLASELGIEPDPSLRHLIKAVPDPWTSLYEQHRAAFLTVAAEIQALADSNRELLTRGRQATEEALAWLVGASVDPEAGLYSAQGATSPVARRPRLVNEVL